MSEMILEPHAMAMSRSTALVSIQDIIDYRKLPRSSGDGMEHAGNDSENSSSKIVSSTTTSKTQNITPRKIDYTIQSTHVSEESNPIQTDETPRKHEDIHVRENKKIIYERKISSDYTRKNTFKSHDDLLSSRRETTVSLSSSLDNDTSYLDDDIFEVHNGDNDNALGEEHDRHDDVDEQTASNREFSEMKSIIKELEERNAKLIEDKTKLCVQLGYQTEVNSELKRLVVAAVGEDLENNLESLLMRNAQNSVEIKHWKALSEEYAEESDKLAIECDVWRTKFMASRMMSDELSSWKTTLYTRFKEMQSALQRILKEREELKMHLVKTKQLLHIIHGAVKAKGSPQYASSLNKQQSVLELSSVMKCLVQDISTSLIGEVQNLTLTTNSQASANELKVPPTPGEKMAIQVLTSNVPMKSDGKQDSVSIITRLGKQYIGNSYHSRQMTNSFRVTFDCCDRCKGAVQVV